MASQSFVAFVELALHAAAPTAFPPGSAAKIQIMEVRESLGLTIHVRGDLTSQVPLDDGQAFVERVGGVLAVVTECFDGWLRDAGDGHIVARRSQLDVLLHELDEPGCRRPIAWP
jgi:hypothetical protein